MGRTVEKGRKCEDLAVDFLVRQGHEIICRNFRRPFGELDIISLKDDVLCVTEVKSLTSGWESQDVRYMVSPAKMNRMRKTLMAFLEENRNISYGSVRFDVATVTGNDVTVYRGDM